MDEYSILKKKRKKNAFAATSLLISIALALLVLVGAVLILGKVNNKDLTTPNDDSNVTLGSSADTTCVGLNKEMLFNYNLNSIKEAAVSYFTNERLPQSVGETVKITLKEMKDKKIILNVIDSAYKLCADDKSYVEVTKEENEYVMKVFLSCSDMEDYILVHLGCYDYCDSKVCEKKEEKKYEYEYKKTTNCVMSPWSAWSEWKLTREDTSNLKKEDIKTLTTNKEVVDTKDATKKVTYNCDKYPGYTLVDDKCVKETKTTDTKDATPSKYSYNCDKYSGYNIVGDKCVKEIKTIDIKDATPNPVTYSCPDGYTKNGTKCETMVSKTDTKDGSYVCSDGYTLNGTKCNKETKSTDTKNATITCPKGYTKNGTKCSKETTTTDTKDATPKYSTRTVKENYTCYQNQCTTKTVFTCPTGQSCGNYPQTSCEKVKKTCTRDKSEQYISGYTCPSGYTLSGTKCTKKITKTTTKDATITCPDGYTKNGTKCNKEVTIIDTKDATFTCPNDYSKNNNKCIKSYQEKEVIDASKDPITYTCPKGYTKNGTKCSTEITTTDTKDATRVTGGYVCPSGYTQNDRICSKVTINKDEKTAGSKTSYTCPNGYDKNNQTCTKKNNQTIKTTYYRYATRNCTGGSTSVKWSTSKNDSILLSEGYKLTGTKKEIKIEK